MQSTERRPQDDDSVRRHPRRPPAHLSVSLKHSSHSPPPSVSMVKDVTNRALSENLDNAEYGGTRSFSNPTSNRPSYGRVSSFLHDYRPNFANQNSSDDYRGVIDDLTIQNKQLRQRLKRYEATYLTHIDDDKLFEVKVHSLPQEKRRELEEILRNFASGISKSCGDSKPVPLKASLPHTTSASSTDLSSSRAQDSAYASMSESKRLVPSKSHTTRVRRGEAYGSPAVVDNHLKDVPEAWIPGHYFEMSAKGKRKAVVQRLEQLFTGKSSTARTSHLLPIQQQEISNQAAKADKNSGATSGHLPTREGCRSANILTYDIDYDSCEGGEIAAATDIQEPENEPKQEQRPTRPLDIDPERVQVPAENMQYIKHLAFDTISDEPLNSPQTLDTDGWIYLNLLVNMAQLHTLNVTPDFVRSAVQEVSQKFEVSKDGKKLRWRGGTEGTRLSSDSGTDSTGARLSTTQSSSFEEPEEDVPRFRSSRSFKKERYIQARTVPHTIDRKAGTQISHYKPLFKHASSSTEGEESLAPSFDAVTRTVAERSDMMKVDQGPLIYFNKSPFYIDLSADQRATSPAVDVFKSAQEAMRVESHEPLGCSPEHNVRTALQRTTSGSLSTRRPFKDYTIVGESVLAPEMRGPKASELVSEHDSCDDLTFPMEWSELPEANDFPMSMEASGLGGTRPADHFMISVATKRTRSVSNSDNLLSKFSAPNAKRRKFIHNIPRDALLAFQENETSADIALQKLQAVRDRTAIASCGPNSQRYRDSSVRTTILSIQQQALPASSLPLATLFYNSSPSIDGISDNSVDDREIRRLRKQATAVQPPRKDSSSSVTPVALLAPTIAQQPPYPNAIDSDEDVEEDDDESIDMLAGVRAFDPTTIAAREAEYDMADDTSLAADGGSLKSAFSSVISEDESDVFWGV